MDPLNIPAKFEVPIALAVPGIIAIAVLGWGCEPPNLGEGGRRGSRMVPFERAIVTFYRPFIVTFPLSLRVSEILPLLCSSTPFFPTPPLVSPKFPHVSVGVGGWSTKSEGVGLCVHAISFQDFQPMWSWSTNVTDRRTDRRTTCNLNTALCTSASRGKNLNEGRWILSAAKCRPMIL